MEDSENLWIRCMDRVDFSIFVQPEVLGEFFLQAVLAWNEGNEWRDSGMDDLSFPKM